MLTVIPALVLVILSCSNIQSQECRNRPFRYPEMYVDYKSCSTIFDWSRAIDDGCRDDLVSYDVQFIDKDCTTRTFSTTEGLYSTDYSPGECLADDDCYARVRAQDRDSSQTRYSTWTGLSHTYQMFHGKYFCID